MSTTQIAAQVLGAIGILIYVIMYHSKDVNNVLHKKFWMDIVWALHYFLIGGYTGCITNVICCAREAVFMNNDKKIFKSRLWLILFLIINWVSAACVEGLILLSPGVGLNARYFFFLAKEYDGCEGYCTCQQRAYVYV